MKRRLAITVALVALAIAPASAHAAFSVSASPDRDIKMTWFFAETDELECASHPFCDVDVLVFDGRRLLHDSTRSIRVDQSDAYSWSCRHTGRLRWVATLSAPDGTRLGVERGKTRVPDCGKPRPRSVSRAHAAAVAARKTPGYVSRSYCTTPTGASRGALWTCEVTHSNTYRTCASNYRLRFTQQRWFGERLQTRHVKRLRRACFY